MSDYEVKNVERVVVSNDIQTLGLDVPPTLIARADEVIE